MSEVLLVPPPSKSDAQRAMVLADITGLSLEVGDDELPGDVRRMRAGLATLRAGDGTIDCRDGGVPFRFLLTQAALAPGRVTRFLGTPRLAERPHEPLLEALGAIDGLRLERGAPWPLVVHAPAAPDAAAFTVTGEESSQFASSLLLGAARIAFVNGHPCAVLTRGPLASTGYLDLTRAWAERAGFVVEAVEGGWRVSRGVAPARLPPVPGDWSSLSYLVLLAWRHGARVARAARGTGHPDEALVGHLEAVGLRLEGERVVGAPTRGLEVDVARCPDAVPALVALAAVLPAPSRFTNTPILRHKESDRLEGLAELITRAGGTALVEGAVLEIRPGPLHAFEFDARDDHRLAMAAGTLSSLAGVPLALHGAASVAKSFPGFWREAAKVGLRVDERDAPPGGRQSDAPGGAR